MNCPNCPNSGYTVSMWLETTGGCMGHSEDEYCYCDASDVHVEYCCTNPHCKLVSKTQRIDALSNKYSIARWLQRNYNPESESEPNS